MPAIQTTVYTLFFVFILILSGKYFTVTNEPDLNKMVDIINEENGKVTEWTFLAREQIQEQDLNGLFYEWTGKFPEFTWKDHSDDLHIRYTGTLTNESLHIKETIQIVLDPEHSNTHGFILYEINGTHWNENISQFIHDKKAHFLPEIFHRRPAFFSCIKGEFDGMMDTSLFKKTEQINKQFQGKIVEKLSEENFTSFTVKSPFFSNEIKSENGTFNLQISLRNTEGNHPTIFVIGTPILTNEY